MLVDIVVIFLRQAVKETWELRELVLEAAYLAVRSISEFAFSPW